MMDIDVWGCEYLRLPWSFVIKEVTHDGPVSVAGQDAFSRNAETKNRHIYIIPQKKKKVGNLWDFKSVHLFLFPFFPKCSGDKKNPTKHLIVNILTFQLCDITLNDIKYKHAFTWKLMRQHRTRCRRWLTTCLSECWRGEPSRKKNRTTFI